MAVKRLTPDFSVSGQIEPHEMADIAARGFKSVICNRPDGEGADQAQFAEIKNLAEANGIEIRYLPVESGKISNDDAEKFAQAYAELPKPILAYCRTGTRSATLWGMSQFGRLSSYEILTAAKSAGYDLEGVVSRMVTNEKAGDASGYPEAASHDIVIVGGGSAGAAVAASLLKRNSGLDVAVIEPADTHYYQPGWTMVGGGIFNAPDTAKSMAAVLPRNVTWIKAAVAAFEPDSNAVVIEGCRLVRYNHLIVCPGLKLNWAGVEGLSETLGKNGVTSNYRYDLAPYTWELVRNMRAGQAVFTQPPMPIKCAGAPQKAMYLSADYWRRASCLKDIEIDFFNAGSVLFGVPDYVPALMSYIKRYGIETNFNHNLVAVDGLERKAYFVKTLDDGQSETIETDFTMLHVCPPQQAPDFVRASPLVDDAGWVDVDPATLKHKKYDNIYGLGDVTNTPNAKTAAAARKQAPVVAENVLVDKGVRDTICSYDGYGSCPLTVERGKIVLAEFTYGGKVCPTFPSYIIDGTKPSRSAWILKERLLPPIYWRAMLKGREWLAKPKVMS